MQEWRSIAIAMPKRGAGYTVNADGYIRITAGVHRHRYYHRVKAAEQMKVSGRELTSEFEVDHLCGNRKCGGGDFHWLILPHVMARAISGIKKGGHRRRKNYVWP
jgi:hypothetical protein